tara:strand:+ start:259 stop:1254 length:996 start_codon:yes stop_codon:yes gene_type:complete
MSQDFYKMSAKMKDLFPSNPQADREALMAMAGNTAPQVETPSTLQESTEVQQGTMPVEGDYSLSDFAALAGVTLNEAQKTGSAGQAKGKDPMPSAKPGRAKHPLKDKLVGEADKKSPEFDSAYDLAKNSFKKYNTLDAAKGTIGADDDPKAKDTNKNPKQVKNKTEFPNGKLDGKLYTLKSGDKVAYLNTKGGLNAGIVTNMLNTNDKKGQAQIQIKNRGVEYAISRSSIQKVNGQEFVLTRIKEDSRIAALEAKVEYLEGVINSLLEGKTDAVIKPRDPNSQYMNDLRKSGAMGAHKDKKKDAKSGKVKHKGKQFETIKDELWAALNKSK